MIENEKFYSDYTRVFDETCSQWTRSIAVNKYFVEMAQQHFNDILNYRGYVFLREVYEHFGWRVTQASIKCGWHRDSDIGDRVIEFKIFGGEDWYEPNLIIDFNVDGDITGYFK